MNPQEDGHFSRQARRLQSLFDMLIKQGDLVLYAVGEDDLDGGFVIAVDEAHGEPVLRIAASLAEQPVPLDRVLAVLSHSGVGLA